MAQPTDVHRGGHHRLAIPVVCIGGMLVALYKRRPAGEHLYHLAVAASHFGGCCQTRIAAQLPAQRGEILASEDLRHLHPDSVMQQ